MRRERWRTWRRAMAIVAGGLAALCLLGSLGLRAYGRMRLRAATAALAERGGSLDLASYELPDVPPAENAATWLEAGASVVAWDRKNNVFTRGSASLLDTASMPWGSWDPARVEAVRAVLAQNEGALATLHRAADRPRSSFGIRYREGKSARVPFVSKLRTAATLLRLEARLAARQGDREGVLTAVRTLRRCADSVAAEPSVILVVVGAIIEADLLDLAADLATSTDPRIADPEFLRRLAAELPQADRQAQLRTALGADVAALIHELTVPPDLVSRILIFPFQELIQAHLVEYTFQSLDATKTPLGGRPDPPSVDPSLLRFPQRMAWVALPSRRVVRRPQDVMAQRQLVSTALALRALALDGTAYPEPEALPASMREPNPLTGLPLEYAREGDGAVRLGIPGVLVQYPEEMSARGSQRRTLALPPPGPRL